MLAFEQRSGLLARKRDVRAGFFHPQLRVPQFQIFIRVTNEAEQPLAVQGKFRHDLSFYGMESGD